MEGPKSSSEELSARRQPGIASDGSSSGDYRRLRVWSSSVHQGWQSRKAGKSLFLGVSLHARGRRIRTFFYMKISRSGALAVDIEGRGD